MKKLRWKIIKDRGFGIRYEEAQLPHMTLRRIKKEYTMQDPSLPPGVTNDMIPGDRPEDIEFDAFLKWIDEFMLRFNLTVDEVKRILIAYIKK